MPESRLPRTDRFWLIHFEDADVRDEVFTDEEAAFSRSEVIGDSFNHTLFVEARGAREELHSNDLKVLRKAFDGIESWKSDPERYCACIPLTECFLHGVVLREAERAAERPREDQGCAPCLIAV